MPLGGAAYNSPVESRDVIRDFLKELAQRDIRKVALAAFVTGVALHACVAMAVLGDGGSEPATPAQRVSEQVAATPTPLQHRTICNEIRGTDYQSEAERVWFQANCL